MRPRTIIVPCPSLSPCGTFPDVINGVYFGGRRRELGAIGAYHEFDHPLIIFVGSRHNHRLSEPQIMRQRFLAECPKAEALVVESWRCTFHNKVAVMRHYPELASDPSTAVLSNQYHKTRVLLFWKMAAAHVLAKYGTSVWPEPPLFLPAERFGASRYNPPGRAYSCRRKLEEEGLRSLARGQYRDGCNGSTLLPMTPEVYKLVWSHDFNVE